MTSFVLNHVLFTRLHGRPPHHLFLTISLSNAETDVYSFLSFQVPAFLRFFCIWPSLDPFVIFLSPYLKLKVYGRVLLNSVLFILIAFDITQVMHTVSPHMHLMPVGWMSSLLILVATHEKEYLICNFILLPSLTCSSPCINRLESITPINRLETTNERLTIGFLFKKIVAASLLPGFWVST